MANWRVAYSLIKLRDQVNKQFPTRNKSSDGTIGDAAHASRSSDHNPWVRDGKVGVVTALDITHDPKVGLDTHALADFLREKRDPRIKYVISNRRIFSSTSSPWQWRKYSGSNPHIAHMHVSVGSSKALYDDERTWVLPSGKEIQGGTEPEEGADLPSIRMVLRRGSSGDEVRIVQRLLMVNVDGMFGPATEQAVKGLQRGADLTPDGIVGSLTWAELDKLEQQPAGNWQTNITATVFGGKKDPNKSAYSNRMISDTELSGALPYRFPGARPPVEVAYPVTGKTVIISLEDVGPWNINDPYWETNSRPQAESGWDTRKRKTNLAGIDLTPAAAKALGLKGLGKVNWRFVTEIDDGEPTA